MKESRRCHSLRAACHVVSAIQSLSPLHPVQWQNQARGTGKLHPLRAIRTENSLSCTNSICQCLCQEKCGPYPEPLAMLAGESLTWRKKGIAFSHQRPCAPGWRQSEQSELGVHSRPGTVRGLCLGFRVCPGKPWKGWLAALGQTLNPRHKPWRVPLPHEHGSHGGHEPSLQLSSAARLSRNRRPALKHHSAL